MSDNVVVSSYCPLVADDDPTCLPQLISSSVPCGVVLVDQNGLVRYVNRSLADLAIYDPDAIIGHSVDSLLVSKSRSMDEEIWRQFYSLDASYIHGAENQFELLRSDGTTLPIDIAITPLVFNGEAVVLAAIHNALPALAAEIARRQVEERAVNIEQLAVDVTKLSERRFRLAFEHTLSGMGIADLNGVLVHANGAFCSMLGYERSEILGKCFADIAFGEDDRQVTIAMHRRLLAGGLDKVSYSKRYRHKSGHAVFVQVVAWVIRDDRGEPMNHVVSVKDMTEQHALAAELTHHGLHDPLTGLANRQMFEERLAAVIREMDRNGGWGAVLLADLDEFKGVNDTFGHHVGDRLLIDIARRLERLTPSTDILGRFGGDEFVYLASGLTSEKDANDVGLRLTQAFSEPFNAAGHVLDQKASVGVVAFDRMALQGGDLLQAADTALHEAKSRGKGHHVVFAPSMQMQTAGRFTIMQDLRHALRDGGLSMYYQPIVDLSDGRVVGFEALMRWLHPGRGWVRPDEFIPLAEQSDLIFDLGSFALMEAAKAASTWDAVGSSAIAPYVSVNLSARQFHDPNIVSNVEVALGGSSLPASRLVLEITETAALVDIAAATNTLTKLRSIGASIALDDFGTGYSSLSYLALLHPSVIKIDRSFVSPAQPTRHRKPLLEAVVSLGHELEMIVLAEGVETVEQRDELNEIGCDLGQGYLFSPAVPARDVALLNIGP